MTSTTSPPRRPPGDDGFTLVELSVAMVLMVVIAAVSLTATVTVMRVFMRDQAAAGAHDEARIALNNLTHNLHAAVPLQTSDGGSYAFRLVAWDQIVFAANVGVKVGGVARPTMFKYYVDFAKNNALVECRWQWTGPLPVDPEAADMWSAYPDPTDTAKFTPATRCPTVTVNAQASAPSVRTLADGLIVSSTAPLFAYYMYSTLPTATPAPSDSPLPVPTAQASGVTSQADLDKVKRVGLTVTLTTNPDIARATQTLQAQVWPPAVPAQIDEH